MDENFVTEEVCAERHTNANERFARDKERLDKVEDKAEKIESLSIQMGEILKNHESKIQNHDERIVALEARPMRFWDKLQWLFIGAVVSGFVGVAFKLFT